MFIVIVDIISIISIRISAVSHHMSKLMTIVASKFVLINCAGCYSRSSTAGASVKMLIASITTIVSIISASRGGPVTVIMKILPTFEIAIPLAPLEPDLIVP